MSVSKVPVVVLISGSGSNLQAILDASLAADYPAEVVAVISNKAGVKGLKRAADRQIPTLVLNHQSFHSREAFDLAMIEQIDQFQPMLVVLAGFMRILSETFVNHYTGRLLNIHPALLPKYKGLDTHQRVLDAGDNKHGATTHFVTAELDGGPLIMQAEVDVLPEDTAETLAARVLQQEHRIYPETVKLVAGGRVTMQGNQSLLDGQVLPEPIQL